MVRLITHNLLACHAKGCTSNNFPLAFKDVQIEFREAEFNGDFLKGFLPKVEWRALVDAARQLGDTSLPEQQPDAENIDLKKLHHVLLEIHVEHGQMICPNCSHVYPISNGIPNMLLAEHEIA
ncbi:Trm112p-domain-containing protein [Ramaria rubella]|nr:Trm112p-domain-containing protein [Ramaria rubella]